MPPNSKKQPKTILTKPSNKAPSQSTTTKTAAKLSAREHLDKIAKHLNDTLEEVAELRRLELKVTYFQYMEQKRDVADWAAYWSHKIDWNWPPADLAKDRQKWEAERDRLEPEFGKDEIWEVIA